jgi:GWxTD domain-containing protein
MPSGVVNVRERSLRGALLRFALAALGALALTAPCRAAHGPDDGPGPLPWRVGGRIGFTVDAAAFPDSSAGTVLEVYVRVPPATLVELQSDSLGASSLHLTTRLRGPLGAREVVREQDIAIGPGDTLRGFGKVSVVRFATRPGLNRLSVRLADMAPPARGLAATSHRGRRAEKVDGEFLVPKPEMDRQLSDIEFVWAEDSLGRSAAFRHGPRLLLPNPERLYGLYATDVRAAFSARGKAGDVRAWHWVARAVDTEHHVRAEQEGDGEPAAQLDAAVSLDAQTLPAGGYDLEVKAWQDGDKGALSRRAHFSIAWHEDSWVRSPRDIEDSVHFLLDADGEEAFAALHPGEQERYLDDFWKRRDPTPETARNEALETFLARVDYANRTYSHVGLGKGMFSDMGRVYIRYGQPSEVTHQVIPAGDDGLDRVVQELSATEQRPIGGLGSAGLGGDMRPYEVWIYEGEIPVPPDADPAVTPRVRRQRLVFLFVDQQGFGQYTLRYSTE